MVAKYTHTNTDARGKSYHSPPTEATWGWVLSEIMAWISNYVTLFSMGVTPIENKVT